MGYDGKPPLGAPDARLLRALRAQYPTGHFDEVNIAIDAARSPELCSALAFLDIKIDRRRRSLSVDSTAAVKAWLDSIEGRDLGAGLQLRRDRIGWSSIVGIDELDGERGFGSYPEGAP